MACELAPEFVDTRVLGYEYDSALFDLGGEIGNLPICNEIVFEEFEVHARDAL